MRAKRSRFIHTIVFIFVRYLCRFNSIRLANLIAPCQTFVYLFVFANDCSPSLGQSVERVVTHTHTYIYIHVLGHTNTYVCIYLYRSVAIIIYECLIFNCDGWRSRHICIYKILTRSFLVVTWIILRYACCWYTLNSLRI